jgi:molecular chaperone GrpE
MSASASRIVSSLAHRSALASSVPLTARGLPVHYSTWSRLVRPAARRLSTSPEAGKQREARAGRDPTRVGRRGFATEAGKGEAAAEAAKPAEEAAEAAEGSAEEPPAAPADPLAALTAANEALAAEKAALKDQLLRSLAEQENIRGIAKRDMEAARNFATTKMAKSLLDVSDNLARALEAVPEGKRGDAANPDLVSLYEGVSMTEALLVKSFAANSLLRFGEVGDAFDANEHNAMFEYEDETKEGGTIGQIMKVGFKLNGRVIRAADVGTVKKR